MANLVILKTEGYDAIGDAVKELHTELEQTMKNNLESLRAIIGKNADFYADTVTPKINNLISTIDGDILSNIPMIYADTEQGIETFINTIVNTDTAC